MLMYRENIFVLPKLSFGRKMLNWCSIVILLYKMGKPVIVIW